MKKVIINAFSLRQGGGQTYLINLLENIPKQLDAEFIVYAPESFKVPADRRIRRAVSKWPTENPLLRTIWEKWALPKIISREKADILFCPGGLIETTAPKGCRTATTFHNMTPFDERACAAMPVGLAWLRIRILRRVLLKSMVNADLTIFISEYAKKVIEALAKIPNPVTIPHGLNADFRTHGKQIPRPTRIPDEKYVIYVSKLDDYKHQYEVIQAFGNLAPALQSQYKLLLVGETNHPSLPKIQEASERLCLPGRVEILGAVPYRDLPGFYHHAAAIIFASSCENCPNILLESLASGRPVLTSDVMPMPEFGGPDIEYFSPFNPDSISKSLERVLTNDMHAKKVAAAAVIASHQYEWKIAAEKTWSAVMQLSAPQPSAQHR